MTPRPVPIPGSSFPALIAGAEERAQRRFLEFFAVAIRNPHTRRAYVRAATEFLDWCAAVGAGALIDIQSLHVAAWIEGKTRHQSAPTVKQHLAAIRHLFDRLVTGQIVSVNPASSVRGPSHRVKTGKTPVRDAEDARVRRAAAARRFADGAPFEVERNGRSHGTPFRIETR
jgi:integrase/recombinase XerC